MGTQAVNFEGRVYNFPSDAKDDEILSFLKDVPSPASGNLPGIPAPPTFNPHPDRSLGAKAGYVINDILQRNPDVAAEGTRRVNQLRDFARPILSTSTPGIVSGMLHKTLPGMTSPIDLKNETIPNAVLGTGLGAAEGMASEAELGVGGNRVGSSTRPAEPAPNPAQMGNVGSRAPSVPTTGPRSGSTISVSEASPLITPREGMQLGKHLLTKNPFGIVDTISSILKRHSDSTTAGEVTEQATGPRGVSVPPANSTTARPPTEVPPPVTVPHHTVQSGVWPAKSTMEWNGETASRSPAPKLERNPPDWKTNPAADSPTELPSVAPQVQGRLADTDVQSLLKRTGPPRGGKAQSARALMRKNIKGMVEEQNPEGEGAPREGTGPGAQLRKDEGASTANSLIDQFDRDRETRNQLDILGGTERRLPIPQREFTPPSSSTPPQSPPPFRRTASPLQKALYDYDKKHSPYNR